MNEKSVKPAITKIFFPAKSVMVYSKF